MLAPSAAPVLKPNSRPITITLHQALFSTIFPRLHSAFYSSPRPYVASNISLQALPDMPHSYSGSLHSTRFLRVPYFIRTGQLLQRIPSSPLPLLSDVSPTRRTHDNRGISTCSETTS